MKCIQCGARTTSRRGPYRATDLGLPNVILCNIELRRCPDCGEEEVVIPKIEQLNRSLAEFLIRKPNRLTGDEIRFLRKCLGWSGTDFSRRAGVERETVSRWEHGREPIGSVADRFLRLAVAHWRPIADYGQEALEAIKPGLASPLSLRLKCSGRAWQSAMH